MNSLSEGLQNLLTNKQHMGNKNMKILQENINDLQKQLLKKDEIIRYLIETQTGLMEILKFQETNQKSQNEIQKVQNVSTNHWVIFPERCQQHHSPSINLQDGPDKSREHHINGHHQQDGKQLQDHKNHTQIPQHSNEEQQLKEPQQKRRLERQIKKAYIGNLHENVTEKDLNDIFGLEWPNISGILIELI